MSNAILLSNATDLLHPYIEKNCWLTVVYRIRDLSGKDNKRITWDVLWWGLDYIVYIVPCSHSTKKCATIHLVKICASAASHIANTKSSNTPSNLLESADVPKYTASAKYIFILDSFFYRSLYKHVFVL